MYTFDGVNYGVDDGVEKWWCFVWTYAFGKSYVHAFINFYD